MAQDAGIIVEQLDKSQNSEIFTSGVFFRQMLVCVVVVFVSFLTLSRYPIDVPSVQQASVPGMCPTSELVTGSDTLSGVAVLRFF